MAKTPAAEVIASLPKNKRESLRIALEEYQGNRLLDLRLTVPLNEITGCAVPTKKGISLNVCLLPALRQALAEAEARAMAMGWLERA